MKPFTDLKAMIGDVASAGTRSASWLYLKDYASRFGYAHLLALEVAPGRKNGAELAVLHADEPLLLSVEPVYYILGDAHPIARRAHRSREPFLVSEIRDYRELARSCLIDLFSAQLEQAAVLVAPLGQFGRPEAYFAFAGEQPDVTPLTRLLLQVAAYATYSKARPLLDAPVQVRPGQLTPRETECLQLSSLGITDAQVGATMGIRGRTVRFHLANAKSKLGATTRIHAIRKAMEGNVIAS